VRLLAASCVVCLDWSCRWLWGKANSVWRISCYTESTPSCTLHQRH